MEENNNVLKRPNSAKRKTKKRRHSTHPMTLRSKKPKPEDSQPDRITELPKEIIYHIFSFLDMKEVMKTTLLSKQWVSIWKSVPFLNFDMYHSFDGLVWFRKGVEYTDEFMDFIDNVLRLRDGSNIQTFRLTTYKGCDLERVHQSVVAAVDQGAQELSIGGFWEDGDVKIDSSVFTSSVRVFKFWEYNRRFLSQAPVSMCSARKLRSLELTGVKLPEGNRFAELRLVCPILEHLMIRDCCHKHLKVFNISAPRLKGLKIYNYGFCVGGDFDGTDGVDGCKLELHMPSLTSFEYKGRVYLDLFMQNFPALVDAVVLLDTVMEDQAALRANKLIKGLNNVVNLRLGGFEIFSRFSTVLEKLLSPFASLRNLSLRSSLERANIHGMACILSSCNVIESLVWEEWEGNEAEGDGDDLVLPPCILYHLKFVKIPGLLGHKRELEFVDFLLKSAPILEEITIDVCKWGYKAKGREEVVEFVEGLRALPRPFPSTLMSFKFS